MNVLRRNDYGPLTRPGEDRPPSLSVSVVIPAHGHQDKLDITLASLAAQTYPSTLLEVVVVDDGTEPALRLPEIRPETTRIVAPLDGGWASAHATNSGVAQSDGDVVLRLDADMLAFDDHVASQLRWHHAADYLAVLGHKRFVDYRTGDLDPVDVFEAVRAGKAASLYDRAEPQWVEQIIEATGGLRDADHRAFRVLVGASFSVHRGMYEAAGGMDADVVLGSDTVFGYRLHQAGALFVPDDDSSAWHLGPRQIASRGDLAKAYRRPQIANRVPEVDLKRPRANRSWDTPLADVVVPTGDGTESCVDAILTGTVHDLRVTVTGEQPEPLTGRHAPLDDPAFAARLLMETYRGEARVRFAAKEEPDTRVPYRIEIPAAAEPGPDAVAALIAYANEHRLGRLELALPQGTVTLERTAAAARAAHLGTSIEAVWGTERVATGPLADAFAPSAPGDAAGGRDGGLGGSLRRAVLRGLGR
ncbi:Glycosyl transferase family 2 [Glycomyces sambucus]|uniref:Glycosyl transferase family 2 n=1 Tax=Glycomyces sambucus TaxID=380244 RepID=A0A1G9GRK2_9ACTN|nr:glycosyltransferase family A protein [Glycomyces sambucus]SDL03311.1 Glycosyl transferase family 2 [Glycomyces sambucus]